MSKTKKIILIAVAAVLVLVIGGVAVVASRLDGIVRGTVEKEGTSQLSLATTLQDADVSLFGGNVTLDKLAVANPSGYTAPDILQLGQLNVGVNYLDLTKTPVRVRDISITSPKLTIERSGDGLKNLANVNVRDLLKNLQTDPNAETTKLLIDKLTVSRAQVVVRPNIQGLKEEYALTLPDVTLNDIGTADEAKNGAEIGRVTADIVMALARKATESQDLPPEVRAALSGDLKGILSDYAGKLGDKVKGELQSQLKDLNLDGTAAGEAAGKLLQGDTKGAVDDAKGQAGKQLDDAKNKAGDELKKGIGGLLGGKKPTTKPK